MNLYLLQQTIGDVPADDAWLSAVEAQHQAGFKFAKRRNDWRLGRWTAKLALATHLHLPLRLAGLATIEVRPDESGAPNAYLSGAPAGVAISISHSSGSAICAIASADAAMGCDLEKIESHSIGFFNDYFTPAEQTWIVAAPELLHPLLMTLVWSAKESALKALRVGLRAHTRSVVVSPVSHFDETNTEGWSPLQVVSEAGTTFRGWWRRAGDFVYTVVAHPAPGPPIVLERSREN